MSPQEAKVIAEFLLSNLEHEIKTTAGVFASVPAGNLGYQPESKSKTALGLLRHVTLEDEWILNAVADGKFGPMPDDSDACGILTPERAVACYNERIPAALARVRALSGEALLQPVDFFGTILPAVVVLSIMLRHSIHHRGQLSTYIRPMGGKVPGIYGPSADTMPAAV